MAAVGGVATKSVTGLLVGSVSVKASASLSGPGPTSSAALTFNVVPGAASQVVLSGAVTDLTAGSARSLTATVKDAFGNTVTSGPDGSVSVSFGQSAGAGSLLGLGSVAAVGGVATKSVSGLLVGSVSVQASASLSGPGPTSSAALTFNVVPGAASQVVLSGAVTDLTAGSARSLTATVKDAFREHGDVWS